MKLWPMAMVTALEDILSIPATEKKTREIRPVVKKKRQRDTEVNPRLKRTVLLYPKHC